MLLNFFHYPPRPFRRQHAVRKADCEYLIRTDRWVWWSAVGDIVEAPGLLIPEEAVEAPAGDVSHIAVPPCAGLVAKPLSQVIHDAEGVVPQRLNLNRLSPPRCHHPIPDLCVHPGKLPPLLAGVEQAAGVYLNAITCPAYVPIDDVRKNRIELLADEIEVSGISQISAGCLKEPEAGINCVV